MNSSMFFHKNLRHLRKKHSKLTQEKLAQQLSLTRSVISSYEDGRAEPNITTLIRIAKFFNVSIENLTNLDLENVDEKQVEYQRELKKYASANNLQIRTVKSENEIDNQRHINLVPEKASAGYTSGYADTDYLKDLPAYQLPFLPGGKEYRAFEIKGDSMLPILPGSIVIGELIEDLQDIREGEICIVISHSDGIVLKKAFNKIQERGTLLLKSSNVAYSPYEVPISEIIEVWRYLAFISREFPTEYDPSEDLKRAFFRMEHEIQDFRQIQKAQGI